MKALSNVKVSTHVHSHALTDTCTQKSRTDKKKRRPECYLKGHDKILHLLFSFEAEASCRINLKLYTIISSFSGLDTLGVPELF